MSSSLSSFKNFSEKQLQAMTWWCDSSDKNFYDAIICDGAVRSGKTVCMSLSFIAWSFYAFSDTSFAICGKTIASLKRNVIVPLNSILASLGFSMKLKSSQNYIEMTYKDRVNRFYLFGGKDEGSAALIQGMTLGGVLLDEVALMPRSFVEQAIARCSLDGSKLWFNCNPESAYHWFKREWVDKATEKRLMYVHFTLDDNPSLSPQVKERYRRLYSGAFYERFILGRWVNADGLVYPMFSEKDHVANKLPTKFEKYIVSCDYGTVNPSSFGLWGLSGGVWYRLREYYYDSRREGFQRTDEEHYAGLKRLCGDIQPEKVICDPSAASFIAAVRAHGRFKIAKADNDVISGIRRVADMLSCGTIKISPACADCIREFALYRWDDSAAADRPVKENDHAMDDVRYFAAEVSRSEDPFFVLSLQR